ncbi:Sas10/Utp3/C1D like protein, partial [Aduncisulcus paluster]
MFLLLSKLYGSSPSDHPALAQLIKERVILDKIEPMETKLMQEVDIILKKAVDPSSSQVQKDATTAAPSFDFIALDPTIPDETQKHKEEELSDEDDDKAIDNLKAEAKHRESLLPSLARKKKEALERRLSEMSATRELMRFHSNEAEEEDIGVLRPDGAIDEELQHEIDEIEETNMRRLSKKKRRELEKKYEMKKSRRGGDVKESDDILEGIETFGKLASKLAKFSQQDADHDGIEE